MNHSSSSGPKQDAKISRSASYGKPIKRIMPSVDSELDSSAVIEGNMILGALKDPNMFMIDADKDMSTSSFLKS